MVLSSRSRMNLGNSSAIPCVSDTPPIAVLCAGERLRSAHRTSHTLSGANHTSGKELHQRRGAEFDSRGIPNKRPRAAQSPLQSGGERIVDLFGHFVEVCRLLTVC